MIQGGDPESRDAAPGKMLGGSGPGYTVPAEFKAENFHKKGAVAGARLPDNINPKKESSGSQFYIVQGRAFSDMELNQMEKAQGLNIQPNNAMFIKLSVALLILIMDIPFLAKLLKA